MFSNYDSLSKFSNWVISVDNTGFYNLNLFAFNTECVDHLIWK